MNRTDVIISDDMIVVHPDKLKTTKARMRARIQENGLNALRDSVIDEELERFAEELAINELAEEMRIEIRRKLEAGVRA